jgi:hypothetical protein
MEVQYWYADGSVGRLKKVTKGELLGVSPKNITCNMFFALSEVYRLVKI